MTFETSHVSLPIILVDLQLETSHVLLETKSPIRKYLIEMETFMVKYLMEWQYPLTYICAKHAYTFHFQLRIKLIDYLS